MTRETDERANTSDIIYARTRNGIHVHQGISDKQIAVGSITEDQGKEWYVFHQHPVEDGEFFFWYGQDPDTIELKDPCSVTYLKSLEP